MMRSIPLRLAGLGLAAVMFTTCSDGGPTASSPLSSSVPGPVSSPQVNGSGPLLSSAGREASNSEVFSCEATEEVRVRFSDPGWVRNHEVGLYVKFTGVFEGNPTLRVWWNYESATPSFEDVALAGPDTYRMGDALVIEKILEHAYPPVTEATKGKVRVELLLDGRRGYCARVREVVLTPQTKSVGNIASGLPSGYCGCYIRGKYTGNDPYDMTKNNCTPSFVNDAKWIHVGTQGVCITSWAGGRVIDVEKACASTDSKLRSITGGNTICVYSTN